jgi:hypothetical protein
MQPLRTIFRIGKKAQEWISVYCQTGHESELVTIQRPSDGFRLKTCPAISVKWKEIPSLNDYRNVPRVNRFGKILPT